jgi:hypothetical protein
LTADKDKPKKKKKLNWPEYNESLVRRGEIMFDTGFLANWRAELKSMNAGKEGSRYRYPNSLILLLLATVHVYLLPYRQLEGFLRAISVHIDSLIVVPDYTTMWWRVTRVKVSLDPLLVDPEGGDIVVIAAVDSTGIKVSNRGGEWIRDRWKKKEKTWLYQDTRCCSC